MVALVDTDILCYLKANAFSFEYDDPWGFDTWEDEDNLDSYDNRLQRAIVSLEIELQDILDATECEGLVLTWTPRGWNYRKDIYIEYKANRKSKPKPKDFMRMYSDIKAYFQEHYDSYEVSGLEADDLLGILATGKYLGNCVICSTDKDLDQIPGHHYNWHHELLYKVSEEDAMEFWAVQVLAGDSTDNYGGIYRVGPSKAKSLLEAWDFDIDGIYEDFGYHDLYKEWMYDMATILTHEDCDATGINTMTLGHVDVPGIGEVLE